MKSEVIILIVVLLIVFVFAKAMIFSPSGKKYGRAMSGAEITEIDEILSKPDVFQGRKVKLRGNIISEHSSGSLFTLDDGTGSLYVDLDPAGVAIPQLVGKTVTVEGGLSLSGPEPILFGHAVEVW